MLKGYRPEIERALRFIAENLQRPLSVAEVARAARLSEFHLHRVFHAALGESVGRFVTRQRLERAALSLAYERDQSITEIALASGYSSGSNFGKAFAAYFGCSPTRVPQPALGLPASVGKLSALHGARFRPQALYSLPTEVSPEERQRLAATWPARVRYETSPARSFACLASPAGYDLAAVEGTWHELIARVQQLGLASAAIDAWGIAHDSADITAPELCRYRACVPCADEAVLPPPLFRGCMLAGRYAVFHFTGPVAEVAEAYRRSPRGAGRTRRAGARGAGSRDRSCGGARRGPAGRSHRQPEHRAGCAHAAARRPLCRARRRAARRASAHPRSRPCPKWPFLALDRWARLPCSRQSALALRTDAWPERLRAFGARL